MKKIQLFVPGRLCLFGEHSDWAGAYRTFDPSLEAGHCIAIGTNQGINATIQPHPNKFIMTSILPTGEVIGPHAIDMNEDELSREAKKGGFFSYSAGVAYYFHKEYDVGGLIIHNRMNLPIKRGLSSSAAVCVLTARAFDQIYALGLTIREQMEYAYLGETFAGSECGRMDQVCAYGRIPVFLTFDGDTMAVEKLSPQKPIYMVIVDLKSGKDTRKILSDLNKCFKEDERGKGSPREIELNGDVYPVRETDYHLYQNSYSTLSRGERDHRLISRGEKEKKIGESVRYALGPRNKKLLFKAKQAINEGDSRKVGELMVEAQEVFDKFVQPACPEELTAPKLHRVLRYPKIKHLIWGGKGVGSQGDGSAQFVAKGEKEREKLMEVLKELDVECFKLNIEAMMSDE